MEEWKEYRVAEVIEEISMGPFGSNIKVDNFIDAGVPVLNGSNLQGFKLNEDSFNYVSQEKADSLGKANAHKGDIVITHRGTLGQIVYIPEESKFDQYLISQSQFRLKLKKDVIRPDFFVYFFHTRLGQHRILMNASQVGVPALARPTSTFKEVLVPVPKMEVQNKILDILHSLDDKIEVNRRINKNLEQQAQALFKSWFVDFEPFKDQPFVESELGMIPQGWRVGTLGDICVTNKRTYKGDFVSEIEYIDTGCVTNNIIDTPQILNPAIDKIPSRARRAVTEGDIIYSSVRPNQRHYALLFNPSSNTVVSTGFVVITANWSGYRYYIYQYLIQDEIVNKLQAIAEQSVSTFPSLNASDLTNLKIVIPPNDVVGDFAALNCSFITQINKKQQESRRLAELRDTLLPRLMSGELKVNDVI